uniref:CCHC-type domain-containing protein n=1 Tax=Hucho hucho TaxID=62062 RepID=A0A4W5RJZ1_9TELE
WYNTYHIEPSQTWIVQIWNQGYNGVGEKGKRVKCFNCQKTGHFTRDCQAPCDYCGRKGHVQGRTRSVRRGTSGEEWKKNRKCYNCQRNGHYARECEAPCKHCKKKKDHRDCENKPKGRENKMGKRERRQKPDSEDEDEESGLETNTDKIDRMNLEDF